MGITPVINMDGKCEDAIHYYEDVFSTKADFILHYEDARPEDWNKPLTTEQKKFVYHSEMPIAGQRFMFSDIIDFPVVYGNNFFTVLTLDTKEEAAAIYKKLEKDSTILIPLHSSTYSSAMVSLIDKFGIRWAVMTEQTDR